jgi:MFS family permease
MKASLLLSGVLLLLFPLAHHFAAILVVTFLFAMLNESVRPPSLALVSDLVGPPQRKAAFALSRLAVNLGMSIGPAIGGILAVFSFRSLFFVDGATSILAGIWLMLAPWPKSPSEGRQKGASAQDWEAAEDAEDLGREMEAESAAPLAAPHPVADLSAFRNRRMLYFLAALIPVQVVFFQLTSTLPLFLVRHLQLPESVFGTVFTLNTLMIVAIEVPLNTAMAHWSHRRTLMLGALLYAIGFGSYAIITGPAGVFAGVVIWTFGEMILMPGSSAYAAEIAPPERRGEYMGLYTMSFSIAFSLGPFLGAEILQRWGSHVLWSAAFASGMFSTILMSRIGSSRPARAG